MCELGSCWVIRDKTISLHLLKQVKTIFTANKSATCKSCPCISKRNKCCWAFPWTGTYHSACHIIIYKQWNFFPDSLGKSNLVNSFSNRQKPQFEDEGFVEAVWLRKFLPCQAVTAHCPLFSYLLDYPVDWGQLKIKEYRHKK